MPEEDGTLLAAMGARRDPEAANRLFANHTCIYFWHGGVYLDLCQATGSDKYGQAALRTARECIQYQLPAGDFQGAGWGTEVWDTHLFFRSNHKKK